MYKPIIAGKVRQFICMGVTLILAANLAAHGTLDQAIEQARQAVKETEEVSAQLRLATLLFQHEEYEEAAQIAQDCQSAKQPDAFLLLARLAHQQKKENAALEYLDNFLTARPRSAEGHLLRAKWLASSDPAAAAKAQVEGIALTGAVVTPELYLQHSALLVSAQKMPEALATLEKALSKHPAHPGLSEKKARLLYQSGQIEQAVTQLEALRKNHPALAFRYWLLEADLQKSKDAQASRKALQMALHSLEDRAKKRPLPPALQTLRADVAKRLNRD